MADTTGRVGRPDEPLVWGYKLVGTDLATDDHQGGRFRYRMGEWHHADPGGREFSTGDCPAFPGDGLCVARTLRGAHSGGARLGASPMLVCGYWPSDVLADSGDKVRVRSLFVLDWVVDPLAILAVPGADLGGAYLRHAILQGADLLGANLLGADLQGAYLMGANLRDANLRDANLQGANLRAAILWAADLRAANLRGADLRSAVLRGAYLGGAERPSWLPNRWTVTANGYITEASHSAPNPPEATDG